jgi:cytochrome c oxidase assembly protein subunit 15
LTLPAIRGFYRLCLSTLIAVYFLILVGGIVRTTGSGMGCPDWPRCFGSWTPPTSVNQLPSDYKENYSAYRNKKNQKFARYLRLIGMNSTADQILSDKSILEEADFNPVKTWIEYTNRLVGVAVGFFIVVLFYKSISFRKSSPEIFWLSLAMLILVIFQGWFGSIVVSTNLTRWTITVHLFLALLMVTLLIYLLHKSKENETADSKPSSRWWLIACIITLLVQIFFGTEVRGTIDSLVASMPRESWIGQLGADFIVHRSFSWIVLIFNTILFFQIRKTIALKTLSLAAFLLILCSLATGIVMAYFNIPAAIQPIHLLIATLAFGFQLLLFFRMNKKVISQS